MAVVSAPRVGGATAAGRRAGASTTTRRLRAPRCCGPGGPGPYKPIGAGRARHGELLVELTAEERKRAKSVLAAVVVYGNQVEVGAFAGGACLQSPLHFRDALYAWGWIPLPLMALRTGVRVEALVPRKDAYELELRDMPWWVRPRDSNWVARSTRWVSGTWWSTMTSSGAVPQ